MAIASSLFFIVDLEEEGVLILPILDTSLQGITEVGPAVRELRSVLGSLRVITRRLEDNPTGFLLNREHSTEFKP